MTIPALLFSEETFDRFELVARILLSQRDELLVCIVPTIEDVALETLYKQPKYRTERNMKTLASKDAY